MNKNCWFCNQDATFQFYDLRDIIVKKVCEYHFKNHQKIYPELKCSIPK